VGVAVTCPFNAKFFAYLVILGAQKLNHPLLLLLLLLLLLFEWETDPRFEKDFVTSQIVGFGS